MHLRQAHQLKVFDFWRLFDVFSARRLLNMLQADRRHSYRAQALGIDCFHFRFESRFDARTAARWRADGLHARQRDKPAWLGKGVGRGLPRGRFRNFAALAAPVSSGAAAAFASGRERLGASGDGRQGRGIELIHGAPPVVLGCVVARSEPSGAKARSVHRPHGTCQHRLALMSGPVRRTLSLHRIATP